MRFKPLSWWVGLLAIAIHLPLYAEKAISKKEVSMKSDHSNAFDRIHSFSTDQEIVFPDFRLKCKGMSVNVTPWGGKARQFKFVVEPKAAPAFELTYSESGDVAPLKFKVGEKSYALEMQFMSINQKSIPMKDLQFRISLAP